MIAAAGAYARLMAEVAALPADGIVLFLHGAGVAEGVDDLDGDLAAAIRQLVGTNMPPFSRCYGEGQSDHTPKS